MTSQSSRIRTSPAMVALPQSADARYSARCRDCRRRKLYRHGLCVARAGGQRRDYERCGQGRSPRRSSGTGARSCPSSWSDTPCKSSAGSRSGQRRAVCGGRRYGWSRGPHVEHRLHAVIRGSAPTCPRTLEGGGLTAQQRLQILTQHKAAPQHAAVAHHH